MNFFRQQDEARRRTGWLLSLFVLALLCLIGLTQLLLMGALYYVAGQRQGFHAGFWSTFSLTTLAEIAVGVTAIVMIASLYKMRQLANGGSAVAEMLGGHPLDRASNNLDERKVLNIVEEMAIASGIPVPSVYVLEESSINAFAAGHDSRDVAIAITRGAIALLSRDELQGVIAHEFSHIFNGDMKINLRLIGWLHGILFIGLVGRFLLESGSHRGSRGTNSKGTGPLMFLGLGLMIIGYTGTFFGKLIKAAISRQREFLADASAVQYTRNPEGIAGALKKIGGCASGAIITHPNAAQASHLFFGNGMSQHFSLFATHPKLEDRIRAIDARWDGSFTRIDSREVTVNKPPIDPDGVHIINGEVRYIAPAAATAALTAASVAHALDSIGTPGADHIAHAQQTLATIPEHLQQLAREAWGASAIVHCLLASELQEKREAHLALLQQSSLDSIHALCQKIIEDVQQLPITLRLPLIDLCLPSLKLLSASQRESFFKTVIRQIRMDESVSLFEWALYRLLRQDLQARPAITTPLPLSALGKECCLLLSMLAMTAHQNLQAAQPAFRNAWVILGLPEQTLQASALQDMTAVDKAVQKLAHLPALAKPRLLKACCAAIADHKQFKPEAVELLRAIADTLDSPIPPVITS